MGVSPPIHKRRRLKSSAGRSDSTFIQWLRTSFKNGENEDEEGSNGQDAALGRPRVMLIPRRQHPRIRFLTPQDEQR